MHILLKNNIHFFQSILALLCSPPEDVPSGRVNQKEEAQQDVADVGEDVVEIGKLTQRVSAQKILHISAHYLSTVRWKNNCGQENIRT